LYNNDGVLPGTYGLPKIYKPGSPLIIIISAIDSPLYSSAIFLHKIIYKISVDSFSYIKNSFHLIEILNKKTLDDNSILISLDVVSFFTNLLIDFALDSISNRWPAISKICNISKAEFFISLQLISNSSFFSFDNIIYRQKFGMPMMPMLTSVTSNREFSITRSGERH